MTKEKKLAYKNELKHFCHAIIEQRITTAKLAGEDAQRSANSEEKSSAGDKYETGRAMSHLEKEMHSKQVAENVKELATLHTVDTGLLYNTVQAGAVICCDNIIFFIAAGLGKQVISGNTILFLSLNSPLAQLLKNKKKGDRFLFNRNDIAIVDVY
ncbi:MAG: hypothetical protein ABJA78_12345 [Ferruginibacter sp.]